MKRMEQFPAKNPNPVIIVGKDGTILYSNGAGDPLLNEWEVGVGEKLPSCIGNFVQRVISRNSPEKIEVKAGKSVYLVELHPFSEEECINLYGFDISDRKELEEKLRENEEKYLSFIQNFTGIAFQRDKDFNMEFAKGSIEDITGYSEEELMCKKKWEELIEKEDLPLFFKNEREIKNSPFPYCGKLSYRIRCKDGSIKWVHEVCQKIYGKSGKSERYQSTITDVTERIKAKESLVKFENARKKEIHHRIKNNLQVISSLLDPQAEKFRYQEIAPTLEVLEAFRESQNRVISMSLIHEELYEGEETDTLDFSIYLQKLAENLFQTYSLSSKNIRLCTDLEENIFLDMDTAVPLGIIINELVSNSLKHAFPKDKKGEIRIRFCREEVNDEISKSLFSLTISDNGEGISENILLKGAESLGMQLVSILVDQLDGKIEIMQKQGTEFRITFNSVA